MTAKLAGKFLLGDRDAILQVARSSGAFWFAIFLVFTAGIARQYDQSFILEVPERWFLGSLLFSTLTGTILFSFFYASVFRPHRDIQLERVPFWTQWRSFMTCYWLAAPIAWLYAIPVERMFDSLAAVQANYILLSIVAAWRVVLIARACAIVTDVPLLHVFPWILLFAAVEFLVISIAGALFGNQIMRAMGGMENSPEERLLLRLTNDTSGVAFYTMIACIAAVIVLALRGDDSLRAEPFPPKAPSRFPISMAIVILLCCVAISIIPQREQFKSYTLQQCFSTKEYRRALDYLAANGPKAFAPSRPVPPKLYERAMYEEMGGVFKALRRDDPQWLCDYYLNKLATMLSIHPGFLSDPAAGSALVTIVTALKQLPGGRDWAKSHRASLRAVTEKFLVPEGKVDWRIEFETALDEVLAERK